MSRRTRIGTSDLEIAPLALGGNVFGWTADRDASFEVLDGFVAGGGDFIDTADGYGHWVPGNRGGESETIIGEWLAARGSRDRVTIATKVSTHPEFKGLAPENVRAAADASLVRLGTDRIDLYYAHYDDPETPLEETVAVFSELVDAGKVRAIGLSEVSAATLHRAHAVHPVAAVQTEYSLWTRNPEIAVLDACRELGAAFVAFSPLARGFLCGELVDVGALHEKDIRRAMPRFAPEAYAANLKLLDGYRRIARDAGCTPAQLALAWLLHQGGHIVPIPGTTSVEHLLDDLGAANMRLHAAVIERLNVLINELTVVGQRYSAQSANEVDTEAF